MTITAGYADPNDPRYARTRPDQAGLPAEDEKAAALYTNRIR
jgi:hypothetical protein